MSALFFNGLKLLQLTDWAAVLYHFYCCSNVVNQKKKRAEIWQLHILHNDTFKKTERKIDYLQLILTKNKLGLSIKFNT